MKVKGITHKGQLLRLISSMSDEDRRPLIQYLLQTGELNEQDIAALMMRDIEINLDTFKSQLLGDALLQFIWSQFRRYPMYLARALVKARPDIFYAYSFAYRLVLKLGANLGPVILPPHRPLSDPDPRVYMRQLPEAVERDITALLTEARLRDYLWFLSRDPAYGLEALEEGMRTAANELDRILLDNVQQYCRKLLAARYPGFVEKIGASPFPSFHVRWWLDRLQGKARILNIGDTGTHKTAFAVLSAAEFECGKTIVVCPAHARENWEQEVRLYTGRDQEVVIVADASSLSQTLSASAPYTVVAYSTLVRPGVAQALVEAGFDGFIWDECHYGKNAVGPNAALRAKVCGMLIGELPLKRIVALSATPAENHPREIAAIAAMLRPEIFSTPDEFRRSGLEDPRFLREFMDAHVADVELQEVEDLPPITPRPWEDLFGAELIDLNPCHRELYLWLREEEDNAAIPTEKVRRLLLATTHPHALRGVCEVPAALEREFANPFLSTKLEWLKREITAELALGGKVVVGTGIWVEGITKGPDDERQILEVAAVLKQWFGEDAVLVLDGSVSQVIRRKGKSRRNELIDTWRFDPTKRILLVSMRSCPDSINLSVPKLPGIARLFLTALSYPWVPWKQFLGRLWRRGQGVPVHYRVPVLRGTIDESLLRLVRRKWEAQQLFRAQVSLTDEELRRFDREADMKFLADETRSSLQRVNVINMRMRGQGESGATAVLSEAYGGSTNAQVFAEAFLETQEYATSGHIARFMKRVIKTLIGQGLVHPAKILDAGCGPLTLARALELPVYGVDLNPHIIETGRVQRPELGRYAQPGYLSRLPDEWQGKFDLTVASLMLDWTMLRVRDKDSRGVPERLRILAELVRVTNPHGQIWIAATRDSMDERILSRWAQALILLGFVTIDGLTGLVRATDGKEQGREFSFWSLCFSPNGMPFVPQNPDAYAFLFEEAKSKVVRGSQGKKSALPQHRKIIHSSFEVVELSGMVEETDKAALKVVREEASRLAVAPNPGKFLYQEPKGLDWRLLEKLYQRGLIDLGVRV